MMVKIVSIPKSIFNISFGLVTIRNKDTFILLNWVDI